MALNLHLPIIEPILSTILLLKKTKNTPKYIAQMKPILWAHIDVLVCTSRRGVVMAVVLLRQWCYSRIDSANYFLARFHKK